MPKDLVDAFADPRITDLMTVLEAQADFDFPIELATISDTDGRAILVQDRVASAHWFVNSCAFALRHTHCVGEIACSRQIRYLLGDATAVFEAIKPADFEEFSTKQDLFDQVFKRVVFDLLHYFGHSGGGDATGPEKGRFLSLADDEGTIRLLDISRRDNKPFFSRCPLIILNCCDAAQISSLLSGGDSFPHRFVE